MRTIVGVVLLLAGAGLFAFVRTHPPRADEVGPRGGFGVADVIALSVAAILATVPSSRRWLNVQLERLRRPTPRGQARTAVIVAIVAALYLLATARYQDRDFIAKFHDEFMHLLQMRMLAHGRLWTAPLPAQVGDFFDTFHVLTTPVYASIYFPGTALLELPTIWLGLPTWMMPLLVAAASVGLMYRITAELLDDGVAGLLAALMLVALDTFRLLSLVVMSHGAIIFLGLVIFWAYLKWREQAKLTWAAVLGIAIGWAAITRPLDALCFAAPVAVALLFRLRKLPVGRAMTALAVACVFAAPFLALQVVQDLGVTGRAFQTPYQLYAERDSPGLALGFTPPPPGAEPQSTLPQKRIFYDRFLRPDIERHRADDIFRLWIGRRFPLLARVTLPAALLVLLIPPGLLALHRDPARWALCLVLPLYVGLYTFFPFLLRHYAVIPAASVLFAVLCGTKALEESWPAPAVRVFLTFAVAGLTIAALPEIDHTVLDDGYVRPTMWFAARELPQRVAAPAIVLFRFTPGSDNVHEEPVYNVDVIDPDDAPILRAHDRGLERNRDLFDYYARRQPQRTVYLYDRASRSLVELGNVATLAQRFPVTRPAGS